MTHESRAPLQMNSWLKLMGAPRAGNNPDRLDSKAGRCELPPASLQHLEKALKKQWKRYRKELKRCQGEFSETAIHDSRVQARRLLSTVELLEGCLPDQRVKKAERALKRHLDEFDDLRDTQVQLSIVGKVLKTFASARVFHEYLLQREKCFARRTRKKIRGIKTGLLAKVVSACRADVDKKRKKSSSKQASDLLLRALDRAFSRTVELASRIKPSDTKTIHRTRVAFKRFRYMVEALADYLPRVNEKFLEALHHYQSMMGDIQDAEVLRQAMEEYLAKQKVKPATARPLCDELLRRRQWLIRVYLQAADQLLEFWPLTGAGVKGASTSRPAIAHLRTLARSTLRATEKDPAKKKMRTGIR